jgi:hypothetical protein
LLKFNFILEQGVPGNRDEDDLVAQQQGRAIIFGEEEDDDGAIIPADAPPQQQIVLHANEIDDFGFVVRQEPPPPPDEHQAEINLIKNLVVIRRWEGRGLCCMHLNGGVCCSGRTEDEIVIKLMRKYPNYAWRNKVILHGN